MIIHSQREVDLSVEEAIIQVLGNGPYIITGNAKLIDTQGNHLENKG